MAQPRRDGRYWARTSDLDLTPADWAEETSDALDRREEWEAGFQAQRPVTLPTSRRPLNSSAAVLCPVRLASMMSALEPFVMRDQS
jgi:hypothetical protein